MNPRPDAPRSGPAARPDLRWTVVAGLFGVEALILSLVADLPSEGSVRALAGGLHVLFPVALAAIVAGAMAARERRGAEPRGPAAVPPWRPLPALGLHAVAFAVTAVWASRLMGPGAPPPSTGPFVGWLACGAVAALLALVSVGPPAWVLRWIVARWRQPLLAVGLGALVWLAAWTLEHFWQVLSSFTLVGAARLLAWSGVSGLEVDGQSIGSSAFAVEIGPECSGVDSVGLVLTFLGLWIALARDRLRVGRALLLLPPAVAAALAANVVRVAVLLAVGNAGYPELAVSGFHSKLGWILFGGLALGFLALAERLPWIQRVRTGPPAPEAERGIAGVTQIAPLLAALAVALFTGLFSADGFDAAYGARIAAALAVVILVRHDLPSLRPGRAWAAIPAGLALGALWIAAAGAAPGPVPAGLAALGGGARVAWIVVRLLGGVAIIPWIEELAFRGFLLDWLATAPRDAPPRRWPWAALVISSLAFGALHAQLLLGTLAGLVFGALRLWRGRLGDAVLAHAACNAALAVAVLAGGRWPLWF